MTTEPITDQILFKSDQTSRNDLGLVDGHELAKQLMFEGMTSQCRAFLKKVGITPLAGRRNVFDLRHVRACLDRYHGLPPANAGTAPTPPASSLFDTWKSQNAA